MNIPHDVRHIFDVFKNYGYKLYLVGGSIRNYILNLPIKDYDFCTDACPKAMYDIVEKYNNNNSDSIEIIPTGEKYGTLTFRYHNENYEITTFRKDGVYSDGRRPNEVDFSTSIYEDLSRRDFTINAIAYNPDEGFIDPYNGILDIKNRIIKTVGNPDLRFCEDALRIMRAVRFTYRFNFKVDPYTLVSIFNNMHRIYLIAKERINSELVQILNNYRHNVLNNSLFIDLMKFIFRPSDIRYFDESLRDNKFSYLANVYERISYMYYVSKHSLDSKSIKLFFNDLKFDKKSTSNIAKILTFLDAKKDGSYKLFNNDNINYTIKELLNSIGINNIYNFIDLKLILDNAYNELKDICFDTIKKVIDNKEPYSIKDLAVNGNDIIALGFKNESVGDILNKLLQFVWKNPSKNSKQYLLKNIDIIVD